MCYTHTLQVVPVATLQVDTLLVPHDNSWPMINRLLFERPVLRVQEEQLEQAVATAAAEIDAKLVQEMQQREESLSSALLEARSSLGNMQRLHQASQNQLFTIQSQTEEQQVSSCVGFQTEVQSL